MVSSGDGLHGALEATAIAAEQLPGSYLIYEVSTSEDNVTWQPVGFKQGLTTKGPGLASLRGLYEPRLQGRLLAAGIGDLTDKNNLWLLNLADKILEVRSIAGVSVSGDAVTNTTWFQLLAFIGLPSTECVSCDGCTSTGQCMYTSSGVRS